MQNQVKNGRVSSMFRAAWWVLGIGLTAVYIASAEPDSSAGKQVQQVENPIRILVHSRFVEIHAPLPQHALKAADEWIANAKNVRVTAFNILQDNQGYGNIVLLTEPKEQ